MVYGNNKMRDMFIVVHITQGNDSCNLCHIKIARQVVGKIAQCNSALFKFLSSFLFAAALVACIAVMFSHFFILSSMVQIYDFHFSSEV